MPVVDIEQAIGRGHGDMRTPLNLQSLDDETLVVRLPKGAWALQAAGRRLARAGPRAFRPLTIDSFGRPATHPLMRPPQALGLAILAAADHPDYQQDGANRNRDEEHQDEYLNGSHLNQLPVAITAKRRRLHAAAD